MRVAIIGSRTFNDYEYLKEAMEIINESVTISCIVTGGANGADSLGEQWANENKIKTDIYLAEWDLYGKSAGFRRNIKIVDNSDYLVAFWDGKSKGTKHSINLAREKNLEVIIMEI